MDQVVETDLEAALALGGGRHLFRVLAARDEHVEFGDFGVVVERRYVPAADGLACVFEFFERLERG